MLQFDQYHMNNLHLAEMRSEAEKQRLARQAHAANPKSRFYRPLLAQMGRQLASLGRRLEAANAPEPRWTKAYSRK